MINENQIQEKWKESDLLLWWESNRTKKRRWQTRCHQIRPIGVKRCIYPTTTTLWFMVLCPRLLPYFFLRVCIWTPARFILCRLLLHFQLLALLLLLLRSIFVHSFIHPFHSVPFIRLRTRSVRCLDPSLCSVEFEHPSWLDHTFTLHYTHYTIHTHRHTNTNSLYMEHNYQFIHTFFAYTFFFNDLFHLFPILLANQKLLHRPLSVSLFFSSTFLRLHLTLYPIFQTADRRHVLVGNNCPDIRSHRFVWNVRAFPISPFFSLFLSPFCRLFILFNVQWSSIIYKSIWSLMIGRFLFHDIIDIDDGCRPSCLYSMKMSNIHLHQKCF